MTLSRHFADRKLPGIAIFKDNIANLDALPKDWAGDDEGYLLFLNHRPELCGHGKTERASPLPRHDRRSVAGEGEGARSGAPAHAGRRLSPLPDLLPGALRSLDKDRRLQRARRAPDLPLDGVRGRPGDRA
ncbi:hypothetical protein [Sphingobium cloacae]|uniref:Uncharacterized protein n=1 Tax=Sphingobium cloacae TaxID=120107 RepID=A0A1E1F3W3_9SPHN|nr:hypothetical protein [Sphingobium cloacae]BAV65197.1 hypothetical protein SCLO_1021570 [Sphingobium cloacae]